jgi:protoporphyrin/coproporphyrin ferrochelatase
VTRLGVVLLNLGGPDRPDAVQPFLFNLFSDPAILRLPQPLRSALAWLIARRRAPMARRIYAHLGGGSPLLANTQAQATALESALGKESIWAKVFVAMRYWHPMSEAVARAVSAERLDELVLLPLYPQYSTTTTASSLAAWQRAAAAIGLAVPTRAVCCFPTEEGYVAALAELTKAALQEAARRAPASKPRIIFSAHGLPRRIANAGDPYVEQVGHTCRALAARLGLAPEDWQLGFQSRVGPLAWVEPATDALIRAAAQEKRAILVVPVAFVSEHSETLVELDIDYRRLAEENGGQVYIRVPTVGCHPAFIAGLARSLQDARRTEAQLHAVGPGCSPAALECPRAPSRKGPSRP